MENNPEKCVCSSGASQVPRQATWEETEQHECNWIQQTRGKREEEQDLTHKCGGVRLYCKHQSHTLVQPVTSQKLPLSSLHFVPIDKRPHDLSESFTATFCSKFLFLLALVLSHLRVIYCLFLAASVLKVQWKCWSPVWLWHSFLQPCHDVHICPAYLTYILQFIDICHLIHPLFSCSSSTVDIKCQILSINVQ